MFFKKFKRRKIIKFKIMYIIFLFIKIVEKEVYDLREEN